MIDRYFPGSIQPIRYDLHPPDSSTEEWRKRGKEIMVGGKPLLLYGIGEFAEALERSPETIRRWERMGVIPKATLIKPGRDKKHGKRRYYTAAQIEGTVKIAYELGLLPGRGRGGRRRDVQLSAFSGRVTALFRRLAKGESA